MILLSKCVTVNFLPKITITILMIKRSYASAKNPTPAIMIVLIFLRWCRADAVSLATVVKEGIQCGGVCAKERKERREEKI